MYFVALACILAVSVSSASEAKELRLAIGAPEASPFGQIINDYSARLDELSGGELTIKGFFSSALGDEQTTLRQAVRGRLDIAAVSTTAQTLVVPEYALVGEPFLFATSEERYCVEDNHIRNIYGDRFSDAGLVRLGFSDIGFETIFSRQPIKVPADLVGVRMRVPPTPAQERFGSEMGASIVFSGITEIIPSLKTGAVDAVTAVTVFGLAIGVPDLAPHMTNVGAIQTSGSLMMSKRVWDRLTDQEQAWLRQASDDVFPGFRDTLGGATEALIERAVAAGATYYEPNEEELVLWRAAGENSRKAGIEAFGEQGAKDWNALQEAISDCRT